MSGLIGLSGLCNFILAFSSGGSGFFCIRCFILHLSMIRLHCCSVLCMSVWCLLVGSLARVGKLFAARNIWTLSTRVGILILATPC